MHEEMIKMADKIKKSTQNSISIEKTVKSEIGREEIESRLENLIAARDEYLSLRNAEIAELEALIKECDNLGVTKKPKEEKQDD